MVFAIRQQPVASSCLTVGRLWSEAETSDTLPKCGEWFYVVHALLLLVSTYESRAAEQHLVKVLRRMSSWLHASGGECKKKPRRFGSSALGVRKFSSEKKQNGAYSCVQSATPICA